MGWEVGGGSCGDGGGCAGVGLSLLLVWWCLVLRVLVVAVEASGVAGREREIETLGSMNVAEEGDDECHRRGKEEDEQDGGGCYECCF